MSICFQPTWLTKLAVSKEEYLFQKYHKMAIKKWYLMPKGREPGRFEIVGPEFVDPTLKKVIEDGMKLNPKYAEWYVYRLIKEFTFSDTQNYYGLGRIGTQPINQVKDYLNRQPNAVPSLNTTMEEVGELSKAWHEMLARKKREYKTHNVITELSDGFQLINVPSEDAQAEGYHMGHCSGSYCEDVSAGKTSLLSIRDAENYPHVTIELIPLTAADPTIKNHFLIEQIKGKENSPQPKYVKYVEEALDFLMQSNQLTFGEEGFEDYTGFHQREELVKQRIAKMHAQSDISHAHPIMEAYHYSQHGFGDSELDNWLHTEEGEDWMQKIESSIMEDAGHWEKYLRFVLLNEATNDYRVELVDLLDGHHMGTDIRIDENDDDEDDETISKKDWEEISQAIEQTGKIDFWDFTEDMRDTAIDYAHTLWENGTEVAEYLVDNFREDIENAYIESLDYHDSVIGNTHARLPSEYYADWARQKRQEEEREKWRQIRETVHNIMARHNIIAHPKIDMTDLYRGYYFRTRSFQTEDQAAAWIREWMHQQTKEWQEYETNEQLIEAKMEKWKSQIGFLVPEYVQLPYWTQREFVVAFPYEDVNQEAVQAAQKLVNRPQPTTASFQWYY